MSYVVKRYQTKLGPTAAKVLAYIYNQIDMGNPFPGLAKIQTDLFSDAKALGIDKKKTIQSILRSLCHRYGYIQLNPEWIPNTRISKYQVNPDEDYVFDITKVNKPIIKRKPLSEMHKEKISSTPTGRHLTEKHTEKISRALIGRTFSDEHKQKISQAKTGRRLSDEHRHRISQSRFKRKRK